LHSVDIRLHILDKESI